MEWFYFLADFWFKMLLTFKASIPLLANLIFRNGRFLFSVGSPTLTALNILFEEITKIIHWSRCRGDPTSVKCKVKMQLTILERSKLKRVKYYWNRNHLESYSKKSKVKQTRAPILSIIIRKLEIKSSKGLQTFLHFHIISFSFISHHWTLSYSLRRKSPDSLLY